MRSVRIPYVRLITCYSFRPIWGFVFDKTGRQVKKYIYRYILYSLEGRAKKSRKYRKKINLKIKKLHF